MKTSKEIKNVMKAIFNVQQSVGIIKKEATGSTGSRSYAYATLRQTWEAAQPALKTNNLVVVQSPSTGSETISNRLFETTIYHVESGEWISEIMAMTITKDDPQSIGAAITYYRRYQLTSMLGLVPDDDNDATEHRLATAQQKRKIVGAVKETYPELTDPAKINEALNNIVGKHPSYIREDEAEDAVELIKAFRNE